MPDAPGLELIRGEIERDHPGAVLDTGLAQQRATLVVDSERILDVLRWLRDSSGHEYRFLSSLHAADYLPHTPRFAIHYELLNRDRVERIRVKALLADVADAPAAGGSPAATGPAGRHLPEIDSCVGLFPTAEYQERETYDFFGIAFRGHPDMTRILLPDDYVGWPLRRDFPIGGEPVTFTYNERNFG